MTAVSSPGWKQCVGLGGRSSRVVWLLAVGTTVTVAVLRRKARPTSAADIIVQTDPIPGSHRIRTSSGCLGGRAVCPKLQPPREESTPARRAIPRGALFWCGYLSCAAAAFLLSRSIDQLVFGQGQNRNPLLIPLHMAALLVTTIAVASRAFSRARGWRHSWLAGLLLGAASQAVAYVFAIATHVITQWI